MRALNEAIPHVDGIQRPGEVVGVVLQIPPYDVGNTWGPSAKLCEAVGRVLRDPVLLYDL